MLGKLLKYELRANLLYYIIMTVVIAGVTFAFCGSIELMIRTEAENPYVIMSFVSIVMLYIVVLVAAMIFTIVIIFKRFYSNNFSQEGYLTFTLPVTAKQIYWSKFISALIWQLWTGALIVVSLIAICLTPSVFEMMTEDIFSTFNLFEELYDYSFGVSVLYVLDSVISVLVGISTIYLAICIGQNFNVHRLIGAIGAYFVVGWIGDILISIISTSLLTVWGMVTGDSYDYFYFGSDSDVYMIITLGVDIVVYMAVLIGGYFYSIHKMSKGLNLK